MLTKNVVTYVPSNENHGINENDTEHKKVAKWPNNNSYFLHSIVQCQGHSTFHELLQFI